MTYVENLDGDLGVSMHYISNIKGGLFHKKLVGTLSYLITKVAI
jgi:hypothetical protein